MYDVGSRLRSYPTQEPPFIGHPLALQKTLRARISALWARLGVAKWMPVAGWEWVEVEGVNGQLVEGREVGSLLGVWGRMEGGSEMLGGR